MVSLTTHGRTKLFGVGLLLLFAAQFQCLLRTQRTTMSSSDEMTHLPPNPPRNIASETNTTNTYEASAPSSADAVTNTAHGHAPTPRRKWAYAYLVGGCHRARDNYAGFLANAAVSARHLRRGGSEADVVLLVQMSHDSERDALTEEEARFLRLEPRVRVKYIPKFSAAAHANFYSLMMEKFRVLDLTEYSRVMFLDGDLMPLRSLDYMFDLSEPESSPKEPTSGDPEVKAPRVLMENVIFENKEEPSLGGIFILKPNHADYLRALEIIADTEKRALGLQYPHWDRIVGFGQPMREPSGSEHNGRRNWTWHGAFADQGFLYHWVKYEKQRFSSIVTHRKNRVVNYEPVGGRARVTSVFHNNHTRGVFNRHSDAASARHGKLHAPTCDYLHFKGRNKPWLRGRDPARWKPKMFFRPFRDWYAVLEELERKANVTFRFATGPAKISPLGAYPVYSQRIQSIQEKAANNWTMYA